MQPTLDLILNLLATKGDAEYGGETVTQLEHALQCAALAETNNCSPELITACLLHDIGHLIHNLGENVAERGIDDRHEYRAIPFLQALFDAAVTEPIRLHVEAKRYLCAINSIYWDGLSDTSKHSLELQGGIFSPGAAQKFIQQPYARDAVQLRIWDDHAKIPQLITPTLEHFVPIIRTCCGKVDRA
jgi:phosphonate degradation associated HDIG domain protein